MLDEEKTLLSELATTGITEPGMRKITEFYERKVKLVHDLNNENEKLIEELGGKEAEKLNRELMNKIYTEALKGQQRELPNTQ